MKKDIDMERMIMMFAKARRIKKEDIPKFRAIIMRGLKKMGLSDKEINLEKYKDVVRDKGDNL